MTQRKGRTIMPLRCVVFASGGGSNFQALLDRQAAGDLHVEFSLFIGNNSKAPAFERARSKNIPVRHCAPSHFPDEHSYIDRLLELFREHRVDLIVLAGYMKKLPYAVVRTYHHRIVNIHPGLLPAFGGKGLYGHHVHEAVLAYGAKVSGVTVHFVDEEYDHGPIILQETVPVLDDDTPETLASRVLTVEHASYWRAIEAIVQGRIRVEGRRALGEVPGKAVVR
jgi:formyltetrahydrofolate-dependent phosphoribosylglycinamide formyltransferase